MVATTVPDRRGLALATSLTTLGRRVLTAIAALCYAVGWTLAWVTPPAVVALVRAVRRVVVWLAAAAAVGMADARTPQAGKT